MSIHTPVRERLLGWSRSPRTTGIRRVRAYVCAPDAARPRILPTKTCSPLNRPRRPALGAPASSGKRF